MTQATQPRAFKCLDAHSAPSAPGIYAWYVEFPLSSSDWAEQISDGLDQGVVWTTTALATFAEFFRPVALQLRASAPYESQWSGSLSSAHIAEMLREMADTVEREEEVPGDSKRLANLAEMLQRPSERKVLAEALVSATPYFSTPLYIGVAEDLQDRLREHRRDYERCHKFLQQRPDERETLRLEGKKLGYRLAAAGIPLEHLVIWTLEVGNQSEVALARRRQIAESVEWLLQRLFRPVFGRR